LRLNAEPVGALGNHNRPKALLIDIPIIAAVLAHGGEAADRVAVFRQLPADDRS
jgi:hypothetical protein